LLLYDAFKCLQVRILVLLGFPSTLYQGIAGQSGELAV
jgi:hypothetical protein